MIDSQPDHKERISIRFSRFHLEQNGRRSLQAQLADQLKRSIQCGELRPRQKLPSTRVLAETLQVSRNTVVGAYEQLVGEGYVESSERSAFTVSFEAESFGASPMRRPRPAVRSAPMHQPVAPIPFRPAQPDVSLFNLKEWSHHRLRVLRTGANLLQYQSRFSMGLDELRHAIAVYLRESRGVQCTWQEIAITGGSQQALFMLGLLLLDSSRSVYMEDPGYPGARRSWEQARATIISVPIDEEGMRLPLPPAPDAALMYVTPSHQFPLGTCMSLARRLKLLQVAHERSLWIVEDDYDAEFRYSSAPQPSLQSLDEHRRVIYVGSFSKILVPGIRIGYVVLPPQLVDGFARLKRVVDDHGPLIDQATLARFLANGALQSHLRRCRRHYRERQALFLELIQSKGLPFHFPITGRGMNLAGHLPSGIDDVLCSKVAQQHGLDMPALSSFCSSAEATGLLFGVTAFDFPAIQQGVERLARAMAALPPSPSIHRQGGHATGPRSSFEVAEAGATPVTKLRLQPNTGH